MKIAAAKSVEQKPVTMPGAENCRVRWLVGQSEGAPNFAMREFEVAAGGFTPRHSHPYEHEIYVLSGNGVAVEGTTEHPIQTGDVLFVVPNEIHQFRNTGDAPLRFLCLVPNSAMNAQAAPAPECGVDQGN